MTKRDFRFPDVETILRDLVDRIRRLETRRTVVIGDYVLEQQGANLVARNAMTGTVTTVATP